MSRKDYALIAGALNQTYRDSNSHSAQQAIVRATLNIADALQADNPRFKPDMFIMRAIPLKGDPSHVAPRSDATPLTRRGKGYRD